MNGEIDIIDFANQLKRLAKSTTTHQSKDIKLLSKGLIKSYRKHAEQFDRNNEIKDIASEQLKTELESCKSIMRLAFPNKKPSHSRRLAKAYGVLFPPNEASAAKPLETKELVDRVRKVRALTCS